MGSAGLKVAVVRTSDEMTFISVLPLHIEAGGQSFPEHHQSTIL